MISLPVWFDTWRRLPASTTFTSRPGTSGVTDLRWVWKLVALTPDTLWAEAGAAATPSQTRAAVAARRIRRMASSSHPRHRPGGSGPSGNFPRQANEVFLDERVQDLEDRSGVVGRRA